MGFHRPETESLHRLRGFDCRSKSYLRSANDRSIRVIGLVASRHSHNTGQVLSS